MRTFKKVVGITAVLNLSLSGIGWNVFAKTEAEIREAIQDAISQLHPTDTPEWWRSLGPTAPKIVISMYENTTHIYHRLRLIDALGFFDDPVAAEFAKQQALNTQDDVIRTASIRSVGRSQGAKEDEFLARFLQHPDPDTRLTAALALKQIGDPRALTLIEKFMKEERTPWVLSKFKSEPLRPPKVLVPVASSEDRLRPEWVGTWKGYWIVPKVNSNSGLKSDPAMLRIKSQTVTEIQGDLTLRAKDKVRVFQLSNTSGKSVRFSGQLVENGQSVQQGWVFDAELILQGGFALIQFRVPKIGGTLVVRRESPPQGATQK